MKSQINAASLLEKLSSGTDGAEVYELRNRALPVVFRAGALESVKVVETAGRALRVIRDGRLGFSTTTDLTDDTTLLENALGSARFGDPVTFQFPSAQPAPAVACFDEEGAWIDENHLIALGEDIVAKIQSFDPELHVDVSLTKEMKEVRLLNSSGLELANRRTLFSLVVYATRTQEDDILIVFEVAASRRRRDVKGIDLAERLIERLRWAERTVQVASKPTPVVFRSWGVLPLLLPFMVGLNGRNVYLGASPLSGRLGEQVFDSRFTLVDDGCLDFARFSAPHDDEGTPSTTKPLIENGVARQFIYDLKTAAQAGVRPTGNGFRTLQSFDRGFRKPPGVDIASWLIRPGERNLEQILGDLDEALLVEQVLGLGQGNVISGEFSNNVGLGFLVRKGEIVGRVKNTMVAGNVYSLLKDNLIALSSHPEWISGAFRAPAIVLDGVSVVSKG